MEIPQKEKFSSPEEEIAFLRSEIAKRERDALSRSSEMDHADHETIGKEVIKEYAEHDPSMVLDKNHVITEHHLTESHQAVEVATHKVEEIMKVAYEKGIRNALSVLEKVKDPFLTDEVHRHLVLLLRNERKIADLNEGAPLWKVLNMTLYEIALPRHAEETSESTLKTIFAGMEQFYAGMQTISNGKDVRHYTLEIAVEDKRDDIIFYVAVPNEFANLFEKQALSLFPSAVLFMQQNDYNIFVDGGESLISVASEKKHAIYPLKTHDSFENDPLSVLLNAFSKIDRDGGGASLQVVIQGGASKYQSTYNGIVKRVKDGEKADIAIRKSTLGGELFEGFKDLLSSPSPKKEGVEEVKRGDEDKIELFNRKLESPILGTNIRLAVSAKTTLRAEQILSELESSFHQFQDMQGNQLLFKRLSGFDKLREMKAFSFREFSESLTRQDCCCAAFRCCRPRFWR